MPYYILKDDGVIEDVSLPLWADWFKTAERFLGDEILGNTRIGMTLTGDCRVVTKFIGIDNLLFITRVHGGTLNHYKVQSSTREKAIAEHKRTLEIVKRILNVCIECNGKLEPGCTDTCRQCETKLKNELARL
jgi:ribosomal protein L40E